MFLSEAMLPCTAVVVWGSVTHVEIVDTYIQTDMSYMIILSTTLIL